ncbi:hypothetical protein M514_06517 [Trichuris suis]|uniref:Uncharacterized protein n=1 Tax=Trichuris suis TaxID=68888 RepID=A0A085N2Y0_9BILA|nr:hypothetical protein M513_06517 [Trichuris suis]KFD63826.1 hypothetical protein M514_06517 [Trichuris suis]
MFMSVILHSSNIERVQAFRYHKATIFQCHFLVKTEHCYSQTAKSNGEVPSGTGASELRLPLDPSAVSTILEPYAEVCEITKSCVQLSNGLGFDEVEYQDIEDISKFQPDELTTKELQGLSVAGKAQGKEEVDDDEHQEASLRELTTAELSDALETSEQRLQWLGNNDCHAERSRIATRGI